MTSKLNDIEVNSDMFKKIKAVTNQINDRIPAMKNNNGLLISNLMEKANLIASHFENVHSQNANLGSLRNETKVNVTVEEFLQSHKSGSDDYEKTTLGEFKKLKNKKSSGADKIPNIVLKRLPPSGIEFLVNLTNNILRVSYFPKEWKFVDIIPVLKPDKSAEHF